MLAAARKRRGWSVRQAAARVRVAHGMVGMLEAATRAPSRVVSARMIAAYRLDEAEAAQLLAEAVAGVGYDYRGAPCERAYWSKRWQRLVQHGEQTEVASSSWSPRPPGGNPSDPSDRPPTPDPSNRPQGPDPSNRPQDAGNGTSPPRVTYGASRKSATPWSVARPQLTSPGQRSP